MYPFMLDFLANNGHEFESFDAGNAHVVVGTKGGKTVSYGQGPYGELGYGKGGAKSSSQPAFVEGLEGWEVEGVGCGYGTTIFMVGGRKGKKLDVYEGEE